MSHAIEVFRLAWRGPFDGLTEQHARAIIDAVSQGGMIDEDDPQHAGLWSALAVIWAADWRAMTTAAARDSQADEREQRINERITQMLAAIRAGTIETVKQLGAQLAADRVDADAQPGKVDTDGIARAVAARVTLPTLDTAELARQFAARIQPTVQAEVHQHYDVLDSLKKAARESFSWMWATVAGVVCALGVGYAVHVYVGTANTIAALRAENAALHQQIAADDARSAHKGGKNDARR
ncbi:MAG: hypothetical protein RBR52_15020 [Thiomonas sp.]|uniref:hypothetical protein n=1 Tax=Thiomonas sp. TaxID=2047785 RepID=UPI002A363775|nr:hypothetical protein [Thiomonas sp.]MDY0331788.1 hypothetical protein [Thiomonas sp.]